MNTNKLNEKNVDEIYKILLPYINKIFSSYTNLTSKEKMILSFKAIINSRQKLDLPLYIFFMFYEKELKILINNRIKEKQKDIDPSILYEEKVRSIKKLTNKEEQHLIEEMLKGNKYAKEKLIISNLYLVFNISSQYQVFDIPIDDIIQAGSEGLMEALDNFDKNKAGDFPIYLSWKIVGSIQKLFRDYSKSRNIQAREFSSIIKYQKKYNKLEDKLKRKPTEAEVLDKIKVPQSYIKSLKQKYYNLISLDEMIEKQDVIVDVDESLEEVYEKIIMASTLEKTIYDLFKKCHLTENEIKVLICKYGLDDGYQKENSVVADIINISRTSVIEMENSALKKIRESDYVKKYAIYTSFPNHSLDNLDKFMIEYKNKLKKKRYK